MTVNKQPIIAPLGLITQPNKYGQYPAGALSSAYNVCMRNPGIVEAMPDWTLNLWDTSFATTRTVRRVFPFADATKTYALTVDYNSSGGAWSATWFYDNAAHAVTMPTGYTFTQDVCAAQLAAARSRYFLTAGSDALAFDAIADTTARVAGLPRVPALYPASFTTTNAQVFTANTRAKYRAVFRRVASDNYTLTSAPSLTLDMRNVGATVRDLNLTVYFGGVVDYLIAGDHVDIYRTDLTDYNTDPGETFRLVKSYALTSADITAKYATVRDTAPSPAEGAELYTNEGLTENGENLTPGLADDAFTFKGYTFYLQRQLPNYLDIKITGVQGDLSTAANIANGIGARSPTGTVTAGSPTITGVSNMTGLEAGQALVSTGFAAGVIQSVNTGASTITMTANATASAAATTLSIYDVLEVNGTRVSMGGDVYLPLALAVANSSTIAIPGADMVEGVTGPVANTNGDTYRLQKAYHCLGTVSARATNGSSYSPALPSLSQTATTGTYDTRYNRIVWSKLDQPEAIEPTSELLVGNGTVYRCVVRRDSVLIFASDGLWRLSGDSGFWRVDLVDTRCLLAARNAVCVLRGDVYAFMQNGIVRITDGDAVVPVSTGLIGDILPGTTYAETWSLFMAADEIDNEAWLFMGTTTTNTKSIYVWSDISKGFTRVGGYDRVTAACYGDLVGSLPAMWLAESSQAGATPKIKYQSTAAYCTGVEVDFQPITGASMPFSLVQWVDASFLFQSVLDPAFTIGVRFDGASSHSVAAVTDGYDWRVTTGIPRSKAMAPRLAPGFSCSSTYRWALVGLASRFEIQSDEVRR